MLLAYSYRASKATVFHQKVKISLYSYICITVLLGVQNPINYMGAYTWQESYTVPCQQNYWTKFNLFLIYKEIPTVLPKNPYLFIQIF